MSAYIPEGYSWSDNIIQSVNWIISCFSAIWNRCWFYVINPFISWITGKTLAVRILCAGDHSPKMTDKILDCIMHEDRFEGTRKTLRTHEIFNLNDTTKVFMIEAGVNRDASYFNEFFKSNVDKCFHQLIGTNAALKITDTLKNEKYDRQNSDHEALLLDLWSLLRPNIPLKARDSDQWSEIGFQGRDPATDFRGLGVLSLSNLVYYARHHASDALHCLRQNDVTRGGYPMAITGIQLSSIILQWMEKRLVDREFYSVDVEGTKMSLEERALYFYQELFSRVFTSFDAFYEMKKPENLLQFPFILKEFEQKTMKEIREGVF